MDDYLTFNSALSGVVKVSLVSSVYWDATTREYSIDGGETWLSCGDSGVVEIEGETIKLRGLGGTRASSGISTSGLAWTITGSNVFISGNIMTLLDYKNPSTIMTDDNKYCFRSMFHGQSAIKNISELSLSATTLDEGRYYNMFNGCEYLVSVPNLPAQTLVDKCYYGMFEKCVRLNVAEGTVSTVTNKIFTCPDLTGLTDPVKDMFSGIYGYSKFKGTPSAGKTYNWYIPTPQPDRDWLIQFPDPGSGFFCR